MTATRTHSPPELVGGQILFRVPDPDGDLAGVNLVQEIMRPRIGPPFKYNADLGMWTLTFPRPDADRMEYMFEITHRDGGSGMVTDVTNPLRAPGPFGDKSAIEFPGYAAPEWLSRAEPAGSRRETVIATRTLRAKLPTVVWDAPGVVEGEPVPVLIAHDGPEYDEFSDLLLFLGRAVEDARLPPMRAVLIAPVDRNQTYSASAAYSRALMYEILPAAARLAPTPHGRSMRVGMGPSLGALALLHAHRMNPALFGALFLQSGSFFRQRYDKQESAFVRFRRISRFIGQIFNADEWPHPIPVAMTCGNIEENLANNRVTRDALIRQGYDVSFFENRDGHNWIGWRDAFDPHLINLLNKAWSERI
jgi:enterochelin esterase-like enzyme